MSLDWADTPADDPRHQSQVGCRGCMAHGIGCVPKGTRFILLSVVPASEVDPKRCPDPEYCHPILISYQVTQLPHGGVSP